MRSLIRYLLKHHAFVLFILLESFALTMVFNHNSFQRSKYLNSANRITGAIYKLQHSITGYFGLNRINRELAAENARLRAFIYNQSPETQLSSINEKTSFPGDSAIRVVAAMVINNTVNRPFNYITLNRGRKDGIKPDQGIISSNGVVGIIAQVSESYAMGLSVLNKRWSISAKLKKNGYFGSLLWEGDDYRIASLTEIPLHVDVQKGDTVITSGYSSIFPEGIVIGIVQDLTQPEGENYHAIDVRLSVDFKALSHVEIIDFQKKDELDELLNSIDYDLERN